MEGCTGRMTEVLYIANDSALGGASYSLLDMLQAVRDRINPTVVLPDAGEIETKLLQLDIDYYIVSFETDYRRIGTCTLGEADSIFANNYQAALEIQGIIHAKKIQIIHTNSSVSNVGIIAALIAGLPHVWHLRELLEEDFGCEFLNKELKRELFACTDKVISISDCVRRAYQKKYNVDSVCIYDGLNIERYFCRDFSLKKRNSFLLAGVISLKKGQIDAVRAVNEIVREGTDIQLYIVGAGKYQYRWILKKFVKKYDLESNVHILGFRENLSKLRERCMFSITSSQMEALGRVTIEAMLGGCVVLGADTGGTAEIIGADRSRGYLYRQEEWKSLAKMMQYAMENKEQNTEIQKKAQAYALENFNAKEYAERIIGIYGELLGGNTLPRDEKKMQLSDKLEEKYCKLGNKTGALRYFNSQSENRQHDLQIILQRWLSIKLENISFAEILASRGIRSVAIYGMGYLGCCFYDELEQDNVEIRYVMDKDIWYAADILKVVRIDEKLPEVDAIVVTVLGDISGICDQIKTNSCNRIISLKELLDWCEEGVGL